MHSTRPRVAIAACRAFDGAVATDLYPDPDWPLLSAALVGAGADAMSISWDHEELDWQRFDLVVTNSTWDSVDRPQEFLAWARRTARATTLANPLQGHRMEHRQDVSAGSVHPRHSDRANGMGR